MNPATASLALLVGKSFPRAECDAGGGACGMLCEYSTLDEDRLLRVWRANPGRWLGFHVATTALKCRIDNFRTQEPLRQEPARDVSLENAVWSYDGVVRSDRGATGKTSRGTSASPVRGE